MRCLLILTMALCVSPIDAVAQPHSTTKTESFDLDPGWVGVNNRSARTLDPVTIRQDFGFSPDTAHAGGGRPGEPGEFGGFITAAAEIAFYGKVIEQASFEKIRGGRIVASRVYHG